MTVRQINSSDIVTALGALPVATVAGRSGAVALAHGDITDWAAATAGFGVGSTGVTSVAGKTGIVTLAPADVVGFNAAAGAAAPVQTVAGRSGTISLGVADISGFNAGAATAAPVQTVAGRTGTVTLGVADISGFSAAAATAAPVQTVAGRTGTVTLTHTDLTDWVTATASAPRTVFTGATPAFDGTANGAAFEVVLAGAVAPTLINTTDNFSYTIWLVQDATGGRVITWPAGWKWPLATPFVLSTAPNAVDQVELIMRGSTVYAAAGKGFA